MAPTPRPRPVESVEQLFAPSLPAVEPVALPAPPAEADLEAELKQWNPEESSAPEGHREPALPPPVELTPEPMPAAETPDVAPPEYAPESSTPPADEQVAAPPPPDEQPPYEQPPAPSPPYAPEPAPQAEDKRRGFLRRRK